MICIDSVKYSPLSFKTLVSISIPWKNHLDVLHNSLVGSLKVYSSKLSFLHWSHCKRHTTQGKHYHNALNRWYRDKKQNLPSNSDYELHPDVSWSVRRRLYSREWFSFSPVSLSGTLTHSLLFHWWIWLSHSIYRRHGGRHGDARDSPKRYPRETNQRRVSSQSALGSSRVIFIRPEDSGAAVTSVSRWGQLSSSHGRVEIYQRALALPQIIIT